MITVREILKDLGIPIETTTASFQGFGTVGKHAAQLYHQMGGTITCVACWNQSDRCTYAFRKREGIDFNQLAAIGNDFGEIDKEKAVAMGLECLPGENSCPTHTGGPRDNFAHGKRVGP